MASRQMKSRQKEPSNNGFQKTSSNNAGLLKNATDGQLKLLNVGANNAIRAGDSRGLLLSGDIHNERARRRGK